MLVSELQKRVNEDVKTAMRSKDKDRLGVLRLITAAFKQKEVDERIELDDTMVLAIMDKMTKQIRDSIQQFEQAGRDDLVAKEAFELEIFRNTFQHNSLKMKLAKSLLNALQPVAQNQPKTWVRSWA